MQDKIKVGIFVSSARMANSVKFIASQQGDILSTIAHKINQNSMAEESSHITYMGLEEAIPVGKKMEQDGMEVIISRRGTAHLLRENLNIPVLSFPTTDLDMVMSLKQASSQGKKILLPVFRNRLGDLDKVLSLLGVTAIQKTYTDTNSLEEIIIRASKQGCDVVVGGPITVAFARENGMQAVELQTSDDIISATMENAKSVAEARRKELEIARRYQTIINTTSDGIIAFDHNGSISVANVKAGELFKGADNNPLLDNIKNIIPADILRQVLNDGKTINDNIATIGSASYVFNHTPIMLDNNVVGGVSTFNNVNVVMKAENKVRKNLASGLTAKYSSADLIFQSPVMKKAIDHCRLYAGTHSTILINGETGTGKELFAHTIHNFSPRAEMPFVSINCAAFPDQLLESELFGYEEGAFTGSKKGGKAGLFELAHKGTIFLDEISAAPMSIQVRLLRVLQEKEVMRLGSDRLIPVDVRVIATANQDLSNEVQKGNFRDDLYFRINILRVNLPPLRHRKEDIPLLADHFSKQFAQENGSVPLTIPASFLNALQSYSWPGNLRQMNNFISRLTLLCAQGFSSETFEELYSELISYQPELQEERKSLPLHSERLKETRHHNETEVIRSALREANYNKSIAAQKLGISRTTLWRKIKELAPELAQSSQ